MKSYNQRFIFSVFLSLLLLVLVTCGKDGPTKPNQVEPPPQATLIPTRVTITPSSVTLNSIKQTISLTARVFDQNNAVLANAVVSWSSNAVGVATVSADGLVTAVSNGNATVTARSGSASASVTISVMQTAGRIEIVPEVATLMSLGETVQLTATVLDGSGQKVEGAVVTWRSGDDSVATVSAGGLVTAVSNGNATITARSGSASASVTVSVMQAAGRIEIVPEVATLTSLGETVQLTATVLDGSGQKVEGAVVTWRSDDDSVATVSAHGLVTAVSNGNATITAATGDISASASVRVLDPSRDREALIALYHSTDGPNWSRSDNWLSDAPLESWFGVSVTTEGASVDTLVIRNNELSGAIPPELGQLKNLEYLDLRDNDLSGPIPVELGQLQNLQQLIFWDNSLTGPIPSELGQLQNLEQLVLGNNQLVGPIPPELSESRNLQLVNLRWNDLTGVIPPELSNLQNLEELYLDENRLTGSIPTELSMLQNLRSLNLDRNQLSGPIPPELSQLQNLRSLLLESNQLTGPIPIGLSQLLNLRDMDLGGNQLTGSIPPELGLLRNLRSLYLNSNQLSGSIPPELSQLQFLSTLSLESNQLTGPIPPELGQLQNLVWLVLRGNKLSGPIPAELALLQNLEWSWLQHNNLSGPIPSELGQLQKLKSLILDDNELTGPIPAELGQLQNLEWLSAKRNKLTGGIPATIGDLASMKALELSHNTGMSGVLPSSLLNLYNLVQLSLDDTGLCVPSDPEFQIWLNGIRFHSVDRCENVTVDSESVAYLTQAVQSRAHPVSLVAGEDALLRVFVVTNSQEQVPMPIVRATFYLDGAIAYTADAQAETPSVPDMIMEGDLAATANLLIEDSVVQPGLEMVIEIDPDSALDPSLGIASRLPSTGRMAVDVRNVPPFDLTLVPFIWSDNPDHSIVDRVNALTADSDLFRQTRDLLPVEEFDLNIHEPVWTSVDPLYNHPNLDDSEENANRASVLLREIRMIYEMEGAGRGYYMGVLRDYGGAGHVSGNVSLASLDGFVIAHELGHNLSLGHAGCDSSPGGNDVSYPYVDGIIGSWGYDILTGELVSPDAIDLMSYCSGSPTWISDYHFTKAMGYRLSLVDEAPLALAYSPSSKGLLIWGGVDENNELVLEPAFAVDRPQVLPRAGGAYVVTGEDDEGSVLFRYSFGMPEMADGEGGKSFAHILPVRSDWPDRLVRITLSGREGVTVIGRDEERAAALLLDRATGSVRGILRDWPMPGESTSTARRTLPEHGLDVITSTGIPGPADWMR